MEAVQQHELRTGHRMTLRPARPDEAEAVVRYINQVASESDNLTFGEGEFAFTVEQEREMIASFAAYKTQLFLIAEVDGEIVGTLIFRSGQKNRLRHAGEFGISVVKKYWGSGIGRHLLQYLLVWARLTGEIRKINLSVRSDNENAIRLYSSMGFQKEGVRTRDMMINGIFYDSLLMGLEID